MKNFYAQNPDGQATLAEIMLCFDGYDIYILDANTSIEMIAVVDTNGYLLVTFELLEDDDGTPDVYQVYDTNYDNVKFAEVARLWADTITSAVVGLTINA